ncbi:MAG: fasciclin domain-containing protein [Prevotella sp.]|nr:fasciclin domain-containing protein [Prevotella sp.]
MSNIKFKNITGVACKWLICALTSLPLGGLGWALTSCSDYDDYNTVPSDAIVPGANQTLWENISSDQQLTRFAELARKCNFSETLNSPRFYTVWAPVNEAISDADYNRLMASDSATIVKQFMQQHITEYNHLVSAALDNTKITSLNNKHHDFTQASFDGFAYSAVNLPATNGVMHKISGMSEFHNNIYENIDDLTGCDSIKAYIQKYDEYYLDVNASVIGPLRDGKQTYLDSVMKKRNNVIRTIMRADLEDEDSTYCMLVPNDKAWNDAYAAINPCYNYIAKLDYMDLTKKTLVASSVKATDAKADKAAEATSELQDSLTCRNIVNNLVFSACYPKNNPLFGQGTLTAKDTVVATSGRYLTNAQTVLEHTIATGQMSNGITRVIDSLTFSPWNTYNPMIFTRRPSVEVNGREVLTTMKVNKLTTHNIALDSLASRRDTLFSKVPEMFHQWLFPATSRFFTYVAVDSANIDGTTGKPEFNFALEGVRSTTYHIYVITVPAQVEEPLADVKPYYLRFYLSWTDASNKQQLTVLPQGANKDIEMTTDEGTSTNKLTCIGDPGRVNVFDLGEFTFPVCYYGLDAYPSLMMMHTKGYTSSSNRKKFDQQMRVAGVYLVPKAYNDMWANQDN